MYYSAKERGFFDPAIHDPLPVDAIEVSDEEWQALLIGNSTGKQITPDANGYPVLTDPPPPTPEQVKVMAEAKRQQLLVEASMHVAPLQDAVDLGEASPEEVIALQEWKRYRIALNRLPTSAGWPDNIEWPTPPA
ncbi:tail fiber assembly protein [Pseudomonas schmalbachii]|uniref:Tail fiber assembly protein n=1 Tax=Pseudomonas schmalbachii TaxID=2816993 RepID=A0ABS3TN72_9PSED|nr:tail fiber assembly protein [Pseudomonas schmalbachii]MBO3274125.1 tail fiber assembly protein [Pseudomonas schmalbachii]